MARVTTAGQRHDSLAFEAVLEDVCIHRRDGGRTRTRPSGVLADKAYSTRKIRVSLRRKGIRATIPEPANQIAGRLARGRKGGRPPAFDAELYKQRNTVERAFNKLRGTRAVATRYDKRDFVYKGTIDVASIGSGSETRLTTLHGTRPDLSEEPYRSLVTREGEAAVRNKLELEMLRGPNFTLLHGDMQAPQQVGGQRQHDLELEVEQKLVIHGRSGDMANRIVMTQETLELAGAIPEDLIPEGTTQSRIPKARKFFADFVLSLPAKGTITRMRMTGHQNPNFVWALGDLNDMMALGTAAAYCDIVVAEKKWGDVLQRHRRHLRARVITDVAGLPQALAAAAVL